MTDLPLSSSIEQAQQVLADLHDQLAFLSPDCQSSICSELDRLSETLKQYLDTGPAPVQQKRRKKKRDGASKIAIAVPENRDQMGMVLRRARAGVFVRDLVHKTVTWSPELYELLGIDPAEPSRSDRFMAMIHPEDAARVGQDTQRAIEQGGTYSQEFRVTLPDGDERWLSSIGYVEQDPDGRPLTLVGINQDISERKKAERELAQAHAEAITEKNRLLAMMDALPVGVVIYDLEGRGILSNHCFEELWGSPRPAAYSAGDIAVYKAWWVESGRPVSIDEWASTQAVRTGKTVTNQYLEIERFDGQHRYVLNSAAPFYDATRKVAGCVVAIRDITEFTQVEKALRRSERSRRESEQRLRLLLASLPITVFMLDQDRRYTWMYNPQLGIRSEQLLGKRDEEFNPQASEEHIAAVRAVLETGQGVQREARTEMFGAPRYFLLSYEPFRDLDETIIGVIGAAQDITERRQLEEEHREIIHQVEMQRQIVENREKERQEIAREIHDGPIQTLVSMMFDLQLTKEEIDQPAVREELDQVSIQLKSAVRELRDVVNNLRPPALLRFGLGKSLKVYAEDFRSKHRELELEMLFDLPDDRIYFSEETTLSLYRLCQEGLNNIVRHAQATKASIWFAQEEGKVVLKIQDNGKGFSVPQDLIRKTKDGHFGLAGMKERVQAMGGEFQIHSSPGAGTTIEAVIPLEQAVTTVFSS